MDQERCRKLSIIVAARLVDSSHKTISSWADNLEILYKVDLPVMVRTSLLLDSVIFGHYCMLMKIKGRLDPSSVGLFENVLSEKIVWMLSMLLKDKGSTGGDPEEEMRGIYQELMPDKHKALGSFKNGSILELFREGGLRRTLNEGNYNVKFIENTLLSRIRLKVARFLGGSNDPCAGVVFLDNKILFEMADTLFRNFSEVDVSQLIKEADASL